MGTGHRPSQAQELRGPRCLPCLLQGVKAACAPMGNSQPLGDRRPPGTPSWAPAAPQQPDLSFPSSSLATGPRLCGGLALLPVICRAAIPTPADGNGTGSGGPHMTAASSPSPAASPAPAWAATMPGMAAVDGRWVGRGPRFPPQTRTHCEAAARLLRVGPAAGRASLSQRPGAATRGASVGCGYRCPVHGRMGDLWGPVSLGKVLGLWLRTRRPGQDTGQSPPHGGQAQPGWTHFGALLASVAT